jgi:hypothetical protein
LESRISIVTEEVGANLKQAFKRKVYYTKGLQITALSSEQENNCEEQTLGLKAVPSLTSLHP